MHENNIILSGSRSIIGHYLIPLLQKQGYHLQLYSRQNKENIFQKSKTYIHLAPIWSLIDILPSLEGTGIQRIIAFSSTSIFTKKNSSMKSEQLLVKNLEEGEAFLRAYAKKNNIPFTLFRPTLIYGDKKNPGNAPAMLLKIIKTCGLIPLPRKTGKGLRSPVFAKDLALAVYQCLNEEKTFFKSYNLSGGENLPYREMLEGFFHWTGKKPRFIFIPKFVIYSLLYILARTKRFQGVNKEMVHRMQQDMIFDSTEARKDFSYAPQEFRLSF